MFRGAGTYVAAWAVVTAALLLVFLMLAGAYVEREREREMETLERSAEFASALIRIEFDRLVENAEAIAAHQGFAVRAGLYLDGEESIGPFLRERVESEVRARGYACVQLLDTTGAVRFMAGDPDRCPSFDEALAERALASGRIERHALELEEGIPRNVRWAVPLVPGMEGEPVAVVLLTSDLAPLVEDVLAMPGSYESMRLDLVEAEGSAPDEAGRFAVRAQLEGTPWAVEASALRDEVMRAASALVVAGGMVAVLISVTFGLGLVVFRRVVLQRDAELAAKHVLARQVEAEERFIASMSHELRTPLNSIIGFARVLEMGSAGPVNDEQRKQLGLVAGAGKRMLALVNDLLDLSKVRAGITVPRPVEATVADIAAHVADITCPMSKERGLRCSQAVPSHDVIVFTDRDLLERALLNLASNAIKFTPTGGSISLEVREVSDSDLVEFAIADTGYGIETDEMGRIMDEFFQGSSVPEEERSAGTGLGLPISLRIARLLGGTIEFTSEVGRGSTFVLRIPKRLSGH